MKTYPIIILLVMLCSTSKAQNVAEKKCLDPGYHEKCAAGANAIFDDFIYLKSRPFSQEMSGELFLMNLKQNTLYMFNLCEGSESRVVINLYGAGDESAPIASTKNPVTGKNTRLLSFYTQVPGKYLISVSFANAEAHCVVVVCGMIRRNIETYVKLPTTESGHP